MKALLAAAALVFLAPPLRAGGDQYGGFEQYADEGSLKPFARDLGGILGAATFHSGRPLGFSGFDVGARFGGQFYPSKGDQILLRKGVSLFGLPWVQAEIGLPFKLDGFIRGISYQGLTIAGGGVRWGIYSASDKRWVPQLLVSAVGHSVVHRAFSASHFGANLVCSAGTPAVAPFVGAGFDRARLVVRSSLLDSTLNGREVATFEGRYTAGVTLKPFQFVYLNLAYTLAHGQSGADAGLGVRF
ncbi:MAG TPA: hypothetical protein DCZ01_04765 [Elusimicrobia bacterium]|nr:MAG: hypothetical protein A2X37_02725 [Elusimicrobia bacterium GWA2_66_18]HAZ07835.1 hypothetical protein [Elusimicrobiota bacterium]